jgi:hypothetical protein
MPSFFERLGREVSCELGRPSRFVPGDAAKRQRLATVQQQVLDAHLRGDMARDQMPTSMSGSNFADPSDDPTPGPIDASDAIAFVRMMLARLSGTERESFGAALADLLSTEDGDNGGMPDNHNGSLDRGFRSGRRSGARDMRRPAQDAALTALQSNNFAKRWGDITGKVEVWSGVQPWRR